jgi:ParB/RepB/Spo0J family partition protein
LKIAIEKIIVSKDNPRQSFDEEGLRRLGESIKEHGQLQAVIVRPNGSNYELVVGERRLRASKLIGLTEIDATIQELDDVTCDEFRLIENTQREDLTEAEKGNAIAVLLDKYPDKYPRISVLADKLQKPDHTIQKWLQKSERLSEDVKKYTFEGKLSDFVVGFLLKFNHNTQDKLAKAIIKYDVKGGEGSAYSRDFINRYAQNPEKYPTIDSLEDLANEVKGVKKVKIDLQSLSPKARAEVERKLAEAKKEAVAKKANSKPHKPRTNHRKQGRPTKPKKQAVDEKKPIPEPTAPTDLQIVAVAFNCPEPLWEKLHRYMASQKEPLIIDDAIVFLLASHPDLKGL